MGFWGKLAGALVEGAFKQMSKGMAEINKAQGMSDEELLNRAFDSNRNSMERNIAAQEWGRRLKNDVEEYKRISKGGKLSC